MVSPSSTPTKQMPRWPQEANEIYEPIRPLGQGGFGSVWMAKRREAKEITQRKEADDEYVAIKVVNGSVDGADATSPTVYAKREVDILSEISHPNIVRLVKAFDGNGTKNNAPSSDVHQSCIILSLAR
eukprot:7416284-Ditylum_brightwellii.AAC.1